MSPYQRKLKKTLSQHISRTTLHLHPGDWRPGMLPFLAEVLIAELSGWAGWRAYLLAAVVAPRTAYGETNPPPQHPQGNGARGAGGLWLQCWPAEEWLGLGCCRLDTGGSSCKRLLGLPPCPPPGSTALLGKGLVLGGGCPSSRLKTALLCP